MVILRRIAAAVLAIGLAAFFAFVGWNKAFASLDDLARYHAWTVYLPETLGRAVGWSEMAMAVGLLGALIPAGWAIGRACALLLVLNQIVAAIVHLTHGESGALPQNAVLVVALVGVAVLLPRQTNKPKKETV